MNHLVAVLLLIAGLIHLLPLPGVLGATQLQSLYGFTVASPDLEILLRHRAVLFGLLGTLLIAAAFKPEWRTLAIGAGLVSAASFIAVAMLVGSYGPAIHRVVVADIVAIGCLVLAAALHRRVVAG